MVSQLDPHDNYIIDKAYAIHNPILLSDFENHMNKLLHKHRDNPHLFNTKDWMITHESYGKLVLNVLHEKINKIKWNVGKLVSVLPMIHGTSTSGAHEICQVGFSTVATIDQGFYGQGVYFTSSLKYGLQYSVEDVKVAIIAYLVPGNSYPVIADPFGPDSLKGKPLRKGYQSHYCLVNRRGIACKLKEDHVFADELMLVQESQVIPRYVLFLCKNKKSVINDDLDFEPEQYTRDTSWHTQKNSDQKGIERGCFEEKEVKARSNTSNLITAEIQGFVQTCFW